MNKQVILITGCSSGIGLDTALALQARGHQVIASCRKAEDVMRLQQQGLDVVQLDVNDTSALQKGFAEAMEKAHGRLDCLINNAGYGQAGALEDIKREVLLQQFETNVFGLLELTNLAIPIMRKQKYGRIINISSILGVISMPMRGAYNASKYAVEGLSDTWRLELKSSGIDVITIEPGPINSEFRNNCVDVSLQRIDMENSYFHHQYKEMLHSYKDKKADSLFTQGTHAVIKKIIHALESKKPKAKYPVTFPAHLFIFLKRILSTRMMDKIFAVISKKELSS